MLTAPHPLGRRQVEQDTCRLFEQLIRTSGFGRLTPELAEEAAVACFCATVAAARGMAFPVGEVARARAEYRRAGRVVREGIEFQVSCDDTSARLTCLDAGEA